MNAVVQSTYERETELKLSYLLSLSLRDLAVLWSLRSNKEICIQLLFILLSLFYSQAVLEPIVHYILCDYSITILKMLINSS